MKKGMFFLFGIILACITISCDKNEDPGNHFSFDGKKYSIDQVFLDKLVINQGLENEADMYQLLFLNIEGTDSTMLLVAVFDQNSNELDGNYEGIDQMSDATRGIIPFGWFLGSAISLSSGEAYFTGAGGNMDLSATGNKYTIKLNKISAGEYNDLFDQDSNGDAEYTQVGTISGEYKGNISMHEVVLDEKKSTSIKPEFLKLLNTH
jgi:hypothetical protein